MTSVPTLAHRIRLEPTAKQDAEFCCACGVARFTWNWALEHWKTAYDAGGSVSGSALKREFNALKGEHYPWVYNSPRDANAQAFADLQHAFNSFFNGTSKYPKFKKKGQHDSFYVANDKFRLVGKRVRLPVIGWVKMREVLRFDGKVLAARVVRVANQWYLSVQVELDGVPSQSQGHGVVGVDLGITHLATLSTGEKIENNKALQKNAQKLKRLSQQLSRKQNGSKNRTKAKLRLARAHLHVKNIRQDTLHKLTSRLVQENQLVVIEWLNVRGMVKNRCLSKAISDCGWGEFRRELLYKAELYGVDVVVADRFYPSSKTCSNCGSVKSQLSLGERVFTCTDCGFVLDRDENAARNLLALGLRVTACGEECTGTGGFGSCETNLDEAGTMSCSLVGT